MIDKPLVSFIMPTRNRLEWIGESISSVLTQTVRNFELIIIDDASDDGTKEFLDDWASKFKEVVIHRNEQCLGAGRSRNIGLKLAKADIVCICDDDDINANERAQLTLR